VRGQLIDPAISWSVSLALALLFAGAALHKAGDRAQFRSVLAGYRLLPAALLPVAAPVVIAAELAAAVLLLITPVRAIGAWVAALLLLGYALALGVNLLRGRTRIDCGCLGFGRSDRISWWMVARNVGLAALALVTTLASSLREIGALDILTIGGTVVTATVLWATFSVLLTSPLRRGGAS
jgi:hypothetical protein